MTKHVVFKYRLANQTEDGQVLKLPPGAQILRFELQGSDAVPHLWALVDPYKAPIEERVFRLVMTGWEFETTAPVRYIGTAVAFGWVVVHCFEVLP